MTYYPINTDPPGLHSRLLAAVSEGFIYPQLPYVPARSESVMAAALVYSPLFTLGPENIAVYLTANYTRSAGAAFRHLGNAVDLELYLDSYTYVTTPIVGGVYPPPDPLALPFEGYYTRTTTGYVWAGIPVPTASDLVWDARWPVVLDPTGGSVVSIDRVGALRAQVTALINAPGTPSFVTSLGGAANTSRLPQAGLGEYPVLLERFLETHYNSTGIPPVPTGDLLDLRVVGEFGPYEAPLGRKGDLAAIVDGDYFVEWVFWVRDETISSSGGLANLSGLSSSS